MQYETFSEFHLGDNLIHLNFLRKLSKCYPTAQFVHATNEHYIPQLQDVIKDIRNISLIPLNECTSSAINAWTGSGRPLWFLNRGGFIDTHPTPENWSQLHIDWFKHLAKKMGLESPIEKPADLLFDYPALQEITPITKDWKCDTLVINSQPGSGQLKAFPPQNKFKSIYNRIFHNGHIFDHNTTDNFLSPIIDLLCEAGHNVVTTQPYQTKTTSFQSPPCTSQHGLTVTNIGNLSLRCKNIIMVSTGPTFPTFNIWNIDSVKFRLIFLDKQKMNLPGKMIHIGTIESAIKELKTTKLI